MTYETNIIGVVGGLGPQASVRLYQLIIDKALHQYHAQHNQDFPHILLSNLPVPDTISQEDNKEEMLRMLVSEIVRLKQASCRKIYIACNTVHLFEDRFYHAAGEQFVSLIDLVVRQTVKRSVQKVAVIASPMTIKSGLYRKRLKKNGIHVVNPDDTQADRYEDLIREHIAGKTNAQSVASLEKYCRDFMDQGCEAVILGCTELPSILGQHAIVQHCISPLEVLADEICRNTMSHLHASEACAGVA